MFEQEAQLLLW